MGQAVEAYIAYGFWVKADYTPDVIEEYDVPDLLELEFTGWGDCRSPLIVVESTKTWVMDGRPKVIDFSKFDPITEDEAEQIAQAHDFIDAAIRSSEDWDPEFSPKYGPSVGEIDWLVWGTFY